MYKKTKIFFFILSTILSGIYFYQSYNKVKPQNLRLVEDYKIQKMNLYPSNFYRLANIIENRPEFATYFRLEKNFTEIFNLPKLYSSYWDLGVLVVSLVLIFNLFSLEPKTALLVSLPPLVVLSFFQASKESTFTLFLPLILLSLVNKYVK